MAQDDTDLVASDQDNLLRLEKIGKGTVLAREISDLVGQSQFFAELSREEIAVLAEYVDVYRAQPGDIIIREGDAGDFMLLIVEGDVDILKKGARGEEQHMTSVGPGMTLGEMSMIDGEPRFATCLATRPTLFAVLTRDNMAKIILDRPGLGAKILVKLVTMLSLRLRQTSARLVHYLEGGA
ncbi:MAG TPA: cyclic nucleotide-binding domain-containing protein [Burkholderiales bacterium]|nr:cyclic nucleotide-binding domain-containing protein [Burkholderiales bacterium]